jgi:hypothetical protein
VGDVAAAGRFFQAVTSQSQTCNRFLIGNNQTYSASGRHTDRRVTVESQEVNTGVGVCGEAVAEPLAPLTVRWGNRNCEAL